MKTLNHIYTSIKQLILRVLLLLVRFYQLFISPILGSGCRFYPSCSHYCQQALQQHGIIRGILLTTHRICRCHPYCEGGIDPVPETFLISKALRKTFKKSCHNG